jgi:hypothetical protein
MGMQADEYDGYVVDGNFNDIDILTMVEETEEQIKSGQKFLIKQSVIYDEWSKRRSKADKHPDLIKG